MVYDETSLLAMMKAMGLGLCEKGGKVKYRKKPVIIEAIQFNGSDSIQLMVNAWNGPFLDCAEFDCDEITCELHIETLEGTHRANIGDYIIKGIAGEFYPCKPDIFEKSYESVAENA